MRRGGLTWSPLGPAAPPGPCVERRLGVSVGTRVCAPPGRLGLGQTRAPGPDACPTAPHRLARLARGRASLRSVAFLAPGAGGPFARAPQDHVTERAAEAEPEPLLLVPPGAVAGLGVAGSPRSLAVQEGQEPFRRAQSARPPATAAAATPWEVGCTPGSPSFQPRPQAWLACPAPGISCLEANEGPAVQPPASGFHAAPHRQRTGRLEGQSWPPFLSAGIWR